jgi:hypothetical protein
VISQSIGSEALCAFLTATFGRLPQRIGRDNDAQERHGLSCKVNALRLFGKTISEQIPQLCYASIPEIHSLATRVLRGQRQSEKEMKP